GFGALEQGFSALENLLKAKASSDDDDDEDEDEDEDDDSDDDDDDDDYEDDDDDDDDGPGYGDMSKGSSWGAYDDDGDEDDDRRPAFDAADLTDHVYRMEKAGVIHGRLMAEIVHELRRTQVEVAQMREANMRLGEMVVALGDVVDTSATEMAKAILGGGQALAPVPNLHKAAPSKVPERVPGAPRPVLGHVSSQVLGADGVLDPHSDGGRRALLVALAKGVITEQQQREYRNTLRFSDDPTQHATVMRSVLAAVEGK
ncbi:MAG: hypothetical protein VKL39_24315, partial [Leptolyngbyaceae bacterium]|nr:hypothetical protein [Leptolyngbyaceae bacterium]